MIRGNNAYSSNTTPDYTWNSYNTTGFFHPSSSTIAFATGGGERMRISTNGTSKFIKFVDWTDVVIDWSSGNCCGQPTLYPSTDWYLQLGTPTKFIGDIYVNHELYKTAPSLYSDVSVKNNIQYGPDSIIFKLKQLKPASYFYKASLFGNAPQGYITKHTSRKQYGFIAQDLIQVFPEMVEKDSTTGLLSVNYTALIPILVAGLQDQQKKIDTLTQQMNVCCTVNSLIRAQGTSGQGSRNSEDQNKPLLYQNVPNPFSHTTTIKCFVPENYNSGMLMIFDMSGKLKRTLAVQEKGEVSINISGKELDPGMYLYSLILDGQEIDTKKMILTE